MSRFARWWLLGILGMAGGCATPASDRAVPTGVSAEPRDVVASAAPVAPADVPDPTRPSAEVAEAAASARSTAIGKRAPTFALPDENERMVSLDSLRGEWVVLYFYPADDTPGCTCQATEFTSLIKSFRRSNARVYGVSGDTPLVHQMFIAKYGLQIPLLSDPQRTVMREYGAWVDIPEGLLAPGRVIRSTFLINPDGIIAWHWPEVIPQGHAERVMQKLKAM